MTLHERHTPHESFKRDPGPDFTEEAIAMQVAAFLRAGKRIQVIPAGASVMAPVAFANAATRRKNDISYSKKDRMRDDA